MTIRHRLPRLWERVVTGDVHHWKARQIATGDRPPECRSRPAEVDAHTTPWVEQLPWPTFLKALDATMLQVGRRIHLPGAGTPRRREAGSPGHPSEAGLRTLIARGEAGDVTMMMALYQRVAECRWPTRVMRVPAGGADVQGHRGDSQPGPPSSICWPVTHDDPDPHRAPWENVAAHGENGTDPWGEVVYRRPDGRPPGTATITSRASRDDEDCWDTQTPRRGPGAWWEESPVDDADLDWYARGGAGARTAPRRGGGEDRGGVRCRVAGGLPVT